MVRFKCRICGKTSYRGNKHNTNTREHVCLTCVMEGKLNEK